MKNQLNAVQVRKKSAFMKMIWRKIYVYATKLQNVTKKPKNVRQRKLEIRIFLMVAIKNRISSWALRLTSLLTSKMKSN